MDDLNDSVKNKINKTYVRDDESLHMEYDEAAQHIFNGDIQADDD